MKKGFAIVSLRVLVFYLIFSVLITGLVSSTARAMFISSNMHPGSLHNLSYNKISDIEKIRTFLERKLVQQRLKDFGLNPQDIVSRLNQLSPKELHKLALHIDKVDYGGDSALGIIISLLVIAILVLVILKLMGKQIIIK